MNDFFPLQIPMAMSVVSIMVCLNLQRMAKNRNPGWDGSFQSLPKPQRGIIWFLSYMQTVPTVTIWLVVSLFGRRRYFDRVPLPSTAPAAASPPALYIGVHNNFSQVTSLLARALTSSPPSPLCISVNKIPHPPTAFPYADRTRLLFP